MKKTFLFIILATASAIASTAMKYKVEIPLSGDFEGAMAFLVNYDTSEKIDSVLVEEGIAEFNGEISEPAAVRLVVDGAKAGTFILEEGDITFNPATQIVTGGILNEKNNALNTEIANLSEKLRNAKSEEEEESIYNDYTTLTQTIMEQNLDNPVGYLLFLDRAYDMEPVECEAFVAEHPYFSKFQRVNKLLESNRRKVASSEGAMFTDFEIEYNGEKHRLSDVVGKGDYVLVDFWASWCGPCIRQTAVLKDIYNDYKDDGLKVLGVAVWDEPDNTLKAIQQHELPWECWLNGQNVPTDAYGISGIPCIILFGPDGTILSRDKQSDELKAAVAAAMTEKKQNNK